MASGGSAHQGAPPSSHSPSAIQSPTLIRVESNAMSCRCIRRRLRLQVLPAACSSRWPIRSEEHTSELQSLMRISYAVFCLKKQNIEKTKNNITYTLCKKYRRQ